MARRAPQPAAAGRGVDPMTASVTFTIVLPATRPSSLANAIASVQRQTLADWELLVVGQGEDGRVREAFDAAVAAADPAVRYLHIDVTGLSRARNAGLVAAQGRFIAMMDDDCEAASDWLEVLSGCFQAHPEVGLIGGAMLAPPRPAGRGYGRCPHWQPAEQLFRPGAGSSLPADFGIVGGNFALRRELIMSVGLFDEHLGVGGTFPAAEDSDYLIRCAAAGIPVLTTSRAAVNHSDGWRYGFRTVLRHQRQRGIGNGALAAKREMQGDPEGRSEIKRQVLELILDPLHLRRPRGLWYIPHLLLGYRRCLEGFRLDPAGVLRMRSQAERQVPAVTGANEQA